MDILRSLRRTVRLMRGRRRSLLLFELLYKASAAALFALLAYGGFFLALRLSGFSYITRENVHAVLSFPVTAAILAVLTFLAVTGCWSISAPSSSSWTVPPEERNAACGRWCAVP